MTDETSANKTETSVISPEQRAHFESLGEARVRDDLARGQTRHIGEGSDVKVAAAEWLAEQEMLRTVARGTPPRPSVVGPIIFAILVIAGFILVASL